MRLFVGIPLTKELAEQVNSYQEQLRAYEKMRLVPKENLHITLHFIGDVHNQELTGIITKLKFLAELHNSFNLRFKNYVLAPNRNPYMVWAKYQNNELFSKLSQAIANELNMKRDFSPLPHITLARYKSGKITVRLQETEDFNNISVKEFYLYESILGKNGDGATYNILKKFNLKIINPL